MAVFSGFRPRRERRQHKWFGLDGGTRLMMDHPGTGNLPGVSGRLGRAGTGMAKIRARRNMLFLLVMALGPVATGPLMLGCKRSTPAASAAEGLPPFTAEE